MATKNLGWFFLFTILVIIIASILGNWDAIWRAMISMPLDRVICYLGGAATMFVACSIPSKKKNSSTNTTNSNINDNNK